MVDELKKGDKIVTNGGLHGVISNMKDDIVVLNIADGVKVEVSRAAVSRVKNGDVKKS
jgi:preprotein translocase subunit YajC